MRTRAFAVAGCVLCTVALAPSAWAEKGDVNVRFGVLYSLPTSDFSDQGTTTELDPAFGAQASAEWMATDLIGIEPALTYATFDIVINQAGVPENDFGEVDLLNVNFGVNFHVVRRDTFTFYVGPAIGYALWGDVEPTPDNGPTDFSTDAEFAYGANVGLDVPFGSENRWGFAAALNYLVTDLELKGSDQEIGVDPVQVKAGIIYRF